MTLHVALAVAALGAAVALFFFSQSRALTAVALLASALEVGLAFGVLRFGFAGRFPIGLALGLALAVPGLLIWLRSTGKSAVSASAVVAFVGAVQVYVALGGLP